MDVFVTNPRSVWSFDAQSKCLSEDLAAEIATVIRTAARCHLDSLEWCAGLSFFEDLFSCQSVEHLPFGLHPERRAVSNEIVRAHFALSDSEAGRFQEMRILLKAECEPFIIGVGNVRLENAPKGFVILAVDRTSAEAVPAEAG